LADTVDAAVIGGSQFGAIEVAAGGPFTQHDDRGGRSNAFR
jgi:hypothetical protein